MGLATSKMGLAPTLGLDGALGLATSKMGLAPTLGLDGAVGLEKLSWDWKNCPGIGLGATGAPWVPQGSPGGPGVARAKRA